MQNGNEPPAAAGLAELAGRVVALGRQGLGRAEIAAALDVGPGRAGRDGGGRCGAGGGAAAGGGPGAGVVEALAAGARMNMSAWLGAMRWRFGDAAGGAADGRAGAAEAAQSMQPRPPTTRYYLPDNFMERTLPDGTPLTPSLRRAQAIAQAQAFLEIAAARLERAQAGLAEAEEELERWREEMRSVEARNYDPDAEDDEDWEDEDGDWEDGTGTRRSMTAMKEITMEETDVTMLESGPGAPETPARSPEGASRLPLEGEERARGKTIPRDGHGRFLPGAPGRKPGSRNLISARTTRHILGHFEARQDEVLDRFERWFLPQYMQMITRLLPKNGAEGIDLEEMEAAARVEALKAALAEAEAAAAREAAEAG
ncbi:MAG TPA: hypothetical protein VGF50_12935 [Caulobacteraceae bacterium]